MQDDILEARRANAWQYVSNTYLHHVAHFNNKEVIIITTTGLYVGTLGVGIISNIWPLGSSTLQLWHCVLINIVPILLFYLIVMRFIVWQCVNREIANAIVTSLSELQVKWLEKPPDFLDLGNGNLKKIRRKKNIFDNIFRLELR